MCLRKYDLEQEEVITAAVDDVNHHKIPGDHDLLHIDYLTFAPDRKVHKHPDFEWASHSYQPSIFNYQYGVWITVFPDLFEDFIVLHPGTMNSCPI